MLIQVDTPNSEVASGDDEERTKDGDGEVNSSEDDPGVGGQRSLRSCRSGLGTEKEPLLCLDLID